MIQPIMDEVLVSLQNTLDDIEHDYKKNILSKEEYVNLLEGLKNEKVILTTTRDIKFKQEFNEKINLAISAASLIV